MELAAERLDYREAVHEIERGEDVRSLPRGVVLLPVTHDAAERVPLGMVNAEAGKAAGLAIQTAAELALSGSIDGMATCPINKEGLRSAGYPHPGHTEFLAELTGTRNPIMMLAGDRLRVTLVTIHCPLREVPGRLTTEKILETILGTDRGLRLDFGIHRPRLAVAGLNPHAGEAGLFGDEESRLIQPAVLQSREQGVDAYGPLPPDTVFVHASQGAYDAVVCMYHDQGLIPLKLLHFSDGVNVTLGLPIVRTSVDHGTAYDIAGTGQADPASLIQAVKTAAFMVANRQAHAK